MRIFHPALQRFLKVVAAIAIVAAIAGPVGWGYEQRQQARTWQETACAYRLREVTRGTTLTPTGDRRNACALLRDLGVELDLLVR